MASQIALSAFCGVVAFCLLSGAAEARPVRIPYDSATYASLATAASVNVIPPGTQITLKNWRQYKQFMSLGLQVLYAGIYFWHVGAGPEYTITVGPTIHIPLLKQFVSDTEKYGLQSRLEKVDTGGYEMKGYAAGLPFPHPSEPELGIKVIYNARYVDFGAVGQTWFHGFQIDRFLNLGVGGGEVVSWRLSHISVPGQPVNPAYGRGYLSSIRITVMEPEQFKYFTTLSLQSDDINVPTEFWVYLADERRPLRLSSSARCAPLLGSDLVNDDQNLGVFFLPADFKVGFLGERKILVLAHATKDPSVRFKTNSIIMSGSVPGWPKPALGQWELRDVYVLDATPLPVMGRYCYAHKVLYIDKETWTVVGMDIYDADSKLWKTVVGVGALVADNNGQEEMTPVIHNFTFLDLQNSHASGSIYEPYKLDRDVATQFQDPAVAAFPGGLVDIMK